MILPTILVLIDVAVRVTSVIGNVIPIIIPSKPVIYTFASLSLVVLPYIFRKTNQ